MTPAEALQKLLTTPASFLKHYPVLCVGSGAPVVGGANLRVYHLCKPDGQAIGNDRIDKPGHVGASRPGIFPGTRRQISSFTMNTMPQPNSVTTNALVVPMVNYNSTAAGCPDLTGTVANMPHYVLDGSGDGLMVTGQLSGCCFGWVANGNDLWCTHVRPIAGITPEDLQVEMRHGGRFAAAVNTPLHTFGRPEYPGGYATVIGVRSGGSWSLYAQLSSDRVKTITGAYRIYPGPKVPL